MCPFLLIQKEQRVSRFKKKKVHYLSLIRLQSLAVAAHFTVEVAQLLCKPHAVMGAGLIPAQLVLQFTALIRCIIKKYI